MNRIARFVIFFLVCLAIKIGISLSEPRVVVVKKSVNIAVTNFIAKYSPSPRETKRALLRAQAHIFDRTGIYVHIERFRTIRSVNVPYIPAGLNDRVYTRRQPKHLKGTMDFNIYPPTLTVEDGKEFITVYGESFLCGIPSKQNPNEGGWGFAQIASQTPSGKPMLAHAVVAITHELMHLLGADHEDDPHLNLMWPDPLPHVLFLGKPDAWYYRLEMTDKSVRQANRCYRQAGW